MDKQLESVKQLVGRIGVIQLFGTMFTIIVSRDKKDNENGRIFIQVAYQAKCTKSGELEQWKGRKYYLSEFMTDDEVIKTCYCAFEQAVRHEVMEAFKVDGITLFNPHINFEELLKVSNREIRRSSYTNTGS